MIKMLEKRLYTNKEIRNRLMQLVSRLGLVYFKRRKIKFICDVNGVGLQIKFVLPRFCIDKIVLLSINYNLIYGFDCNKGFEVYYHKDWKDDSPLFEDKEKTKSDNYK